MLTPNPVLLFADGDRARLDRLERSLASHQDRWQMLFVGSVAEAQTQLAARSVDALVADTALADAGGILQLLDHARAVIPHAIRIAISSHDSEELTLESLHATHRFLHRPISDDALKSALIDALQLRETLRREALVEAVARLHSIPALPEIYDELMAEMAAESGTVLRMGQIIERDMGLSSTLLRVVNSAFYGLYRHVESPSTAATLLGAEVIKNMAMSEKLFARFASENTALTKLAALNRCAHVTGLLCLRFARASGLTGRALDHAQVSGLLSRLGDLIVEADLADETPLRDHGVTRETIAAHVLDRWAMPDAVVTAVCFQRIGRPGPSAPQADPEPRDILHAVRLLQELLPSGLRPGSDAIDAAQLTLAACHSPTLAETWIHQYIEWLAQDIALAA